MNEIDESGLTSDDMEELKKRPFEYALVRYMQLYPFKHRIWIMAAHFGFLFGCIIAIFTSWYAIPIATLIWPFIFFALAAKGFWGWLYGKSQGV